MSEITRGAIGMPFDMAMETELSRRQFHSIAQELLAERDHLKAENDTLKAAAMGIRDVWREDQAELEALRKDAERYRWTAIDGNWLARMFGKWRAHTGEYGEANPTAWYPSRGEAIDAAISHAKALAKEASHG